ncbi:MAG: glycosyltransferase family 2 protein [Ktedonobacteraceae bacterium]|nr:glycosyltransferase family 2 protein [Ktedonobacteraceae bacterium]
MEEHVSSQHPRISVIVPARNEALNLLYVLPRIPSFVHEVILVDGHSTDDTIAVAKHLLPTIRIIEQTGHGKGDAIKVGLAASTGNIIVLLDADGSADPLEIPRFIEVLLAGNDFAKGSRFAKGGDSYDITLLRHAGNYMLNQLVNLLFRTHFTDLCYGYNACWKHCFDSIEIDSDGFEIETLVNIRAHVAGLNILEVPSFEHPRVHGKSNLNTFKDGWRVLRTIFREYWRSKHGPAPVTTAHKPAAPTVERPPVPEEVVL